MTSRPGCILLVSLCCLLALATSASAESAWVLWFRQDHQPKDYWTVQTAYRTADACIKALDASEKGTGDPKLDAGMNKHRSEPTGPLLLWRGDRNIKWLCLPDTVAPRGPKGK